MVTGNVRNFWGELEQLVIYCYKSGLYFIL